MVMAKKDVFAEKEGYDEPIEPLDLDLLSKKRASRRVSGSGDFLTGSDGIQGFLARKVVPDASDSVAVKIPKVVYSALSPDGSRWGALQNWIAKRDANVILGRLFEDLHSFIADGNDELPYSWIDRHDLYSACGVLRQAYQEVFKSASRDNRLDEEKKRVASLEVQIRELRIELSDALRENRSLRASLADLSASLAKKSEKSIDIGDIFRGIKR